MITVLATIIISMMMTVIVSIVASRPNSDSEHKIGRPRQLYTGEARREFVGIDNRR